MDSEMVVAGAIIDSWIEPTQAEADPTRLGVASGPARAAQGSGDRRGGAFAGSGSLLASGSERTPLPW